MVMTRQHAVISRSMCSSSSSMKRGFGRNTRQKPRVSGVVSRWKLWSRVESSRGGVVVVRAKMSAEEAAETLELAQMDAEERMEKAVDVVAGNYSTVRTGRASISLLDRGKVMYYETETPLKSLASVSTPDAQTLLIQPFDKSCLADVERAICESDVGLTPNSDGDVIRLNVPQLTTERRKELVKTVGKLAEEGKVALRNVRRDALKEISQLEGLSEDLVKEAENNVQALTDKNVGKLEQMAKAKEAELMKV